MTVKQKIIDRVNSIEDETVLNEIYNLISTEKKIDKVYEFSSNELKQVNEAIDDADNGRYFTQKESEKLIAKWFQEKSVGL
ncbi:hypothetical protein [Aequorivita capsosiphonis]|uniref:hypothetical protein n=1 Tax=Aequorivita capsosiphonis TaxID=487317 RepID=UPI0003F4C460|nr:hypothetical protein [Aequorivita capsosiphonis]